MSKSNESLQIIYGRLYELIEAFKKGEITVEYYSNRHAFITDEIRKITESKEEERDDRASNN